MLRRAVSGGCLLQGGGSASLLSMLRRAAAGGRLLQGGGSASLLSMLRRTPSGGRLLQGGRECFALEHASAGGCWWVFTARGEGVLRS